MRIEPYTLCLILLVASVAGGVEQARSVGELDAPERLMVEGTVAFSARDVRERLWQVAHIQRVSWRSAPLRQYLDVLRDLTAAGYHRAGFADVEVRTVVDQHARRIALTIREGPRYLARSVKVTGVAEDVRRHVATRLARSRPPSAFAQGGQDQGEARDSSWIRCAEADDQSEDPLWLEGKPANFAASFRAKLRKRVARALDESGYDQAKFEISIEREGNHADLVVNVSELGKAKVIRRIDVVGNKKNTAHEIIDCAKVSPGMLLTASRKACITGRLRESARFRSQRLDVKRARDGVDLTIHVVEYSPAPRLVEKLSREEAALLKCRRWLLSDAGRKYEYVLSGYLQKDPLWSFRSVISPADGMVVVVHSPQSSSRGAYGECGLLLRGGHASSFSMSDRKKLEFATGGVQIQQKITFALAPEEEHTYQTLMSFGRKPIEKCERKGPFDLTVVFEPVCCLAMVHEHVERLEWTRDILAVTTKDHRIRIDARTGRLLEYAMLFGQGNGEPFLVLTTALGRFRKSARQYEHATAACQPCLDANKPVSSFVSFGLSLPLLSMVNSHMVHGRGILTSTNRRILRKLVDDGALRPIDDFWRSGSHESGDKFTIPSAVGVRSRAELTYLLMADQWFIRGTWPWHVWRGACFGLAGERRRVTEIYRRLYDSNDCGPLGWWIIARLLAYANNPFAAHAASRAMQALGHDSFLADCRMLLDNRSAVGCALRQIAQSIGQLSLQDARALGNLLVTLGIIGDAQTLVEFVDTYHRRHAAPDALLGTLSELWEGDLGDMLQWDLCRLRGDERGRATAFPIPRTVARPPSR